MSENINTHDIREPYLYLEKALGNARLSNGELENIASDLSQSEEELSVLHKAIITFEKLHGIQIDKQAFYDFLVYICRLHLGQVRKYEGSKPYLVHLLRVAARALKYTPSLIAIYCRQDADVKGEFYNLIKGKEDFVKELATVVLLSALAHDSVEDRSGKIIYHEGYGDMLSDLEKRAHALNLIEQRIGQVARHYVATLTFIPKDANKKEEEYGEWLNAIFESKDPLGITLKLADIIDNVLSTDIKKNEEYREKISGTLTKYKRALERFLDFVGENTTAFAPQLQPVVQDAKLALEHINKQLQQ